MILGHRAFRRKRRHDGQRVGLGELDEIVRRARPERAAPDVNQRPLRRLEQLDQLIDIVGIGTETHTPGLVIRRKVRLRHADVLRDLDDHRPRPSGARQRKGAAKHFRDSFRRRHAEGPLRHGLKRVEIRNFLKHSFRQLLARAVTEDNHQRHTIGEGIHDSGKSIAAPRALGDHRDADLAGAARIAVGDVHRRLLMARQDQSHLAIFMQGVEDRQNIVARQCGHEFYLFGLENIDYGIGDAHGSFFLSIGKFFEEAFFFQLPDKS